MKKNLHYCCMGSAYANETRHAQTVMKELGITYEQSTPQSMMDCWQFWNCENVPDVLPEFITEMKHGPLIYIGRGLSADDAKRLDANK